MSMFLPNCAKAQMEQAKGPSLQWASAQMGQDPNPNGEPGLQRISLLQAPKQPPSIYIYIYIIYIYICNNQ